MKVGWILLGAFALLYIITSIEAFGWFVLIVFAVMLTITIVSPEKARFKGDIEFEKEKDRKNEAELTKRFYDEISNKNQPNED